jgi:multidrug efflux pump subunit AcrA (membrane-fusion protein)
VDADPDLLRPGKRVHGAVLTDRHEGRLVAPAAAVRSGPSGPLVVRKTLFGGALRDVELGTRSGDRVEIVAGLEAGDRVLVTP